MVLHPWPGSFQLIRDMALVDPRVGDLACVWDRPAHRRVEFG